MPQTQSFHSVGPLKFNSDHPAWTKKSFFKIPTNQDTKAYARCSFFQLLGLFKIWSFKVGNYQHLFSGSYESKLGRDGDFLNHHGKYLSGLNLKGLVLFPVLLNLQFLKGKTTWTCFIDPRDSQ